MKKLFQDEGGHEDEGEGNKDDGQGDSSIY